MAFWFILSLIILTIHLLDKHLMSYWSNLEIPQKGPTFLVGNLSANLLGFKGFGEFFLDVYERCKNNKIIGLYFFHRPVLCINDPQLIQDVLIRDFNNFHDRSNPVNEQKNPLSAHLFSLTGQRWRDLRVKLSPTFTSAKLKAMYPKMNECAKVLEEFLVKNFESGKREFEFRDLFARYTTNIISSVAFGVDNDCINDPENIFRKMGLRIFETSFKKSFLRFLVISMPRIFARLNVKSADATVEDFFFDLVQKTIDYREKNKNNERKDFMQLLIQLKNQGYVSVDKNDEENSIESQLKLQNLTFNDIVAQAFLFFFAGEEN
jgi:cytochrome P450 family 6